VKLNQPDWSSHSHIVAFTAELRTENLLLHLMLNAFWGSLEFELPLPGSGRSWRRWIDTALGSPQDIVPWQESQPVAGFTYGVQARSVVVLLAALN
jgi:glycogen operon protein